MNYLNQKGRQGRSIGREHGHMAHFVQIRLHRPEWPAQFPVSHLRRPSRLRETLGEQLQLISVHTWKRMLEPIECDRTPLCGNDAGKHPRELFLVR